MALCIKRWGGEKLARELSKLTGESLTEAVVHWLERRLAEERKASRRRRSIDDLVDRFGQLPILDTRSSDEILGYDEDGLPR